MMTMMTIDDNDNDDDNDDSNDNKEIQNSPGGVTAASSMFTLSGSEKNHQDTLSTGGPKALFSDTGVNKKLFAWRFYAEQFQNLLLMIGSF